MPPSEVSFKPIEDTMALVEMPVSARTPIDLFATLALSPPLASGHPSAVPSICFLPSTPPTASTKLQQLKERLYGHLANDSSDIGDNNVSAEGRDEVKTIISEKGIPTPEASDEDDHDRGHGVPLSARFIPPHTVPSPPKPTHRPLASNEARQLSLLLIQHFFPLRSHPRGMMKESIALAEQLHDAGIRWDTKRRVMGMHLRGIWEEGQRLAVAGRSIGGHGPMEWVDLCPSTLLLSLRPLFSRYPQGPLRRSS